MNVAFPVGRWHVVTEEALSPACGGASGPAPESPGFPALGPRTTGPCATETGRSGREGTAPREGRVRAPSAWCRSVPSAHGELRCAPSMDSLCFRKECVLAEGSRSRAGDHLLPEDM